MLVLLIIKSKITSDIPKKWHTNWLKAVQKTLGLEQTGKYSEDMLHYTPLMDLGYQGEIVTRVQNKLRHLQYQQIELMVNVIV